MDIVTGAMAEEVVLAGVVRKAVQERPHRIGADVKVRQAKKEIHPNKKIFSSE